LIALPVNTACHVTGLLLTSLLLSDSTRARTLASRPVTSKFSARHAVHIQERLILSEAINLWREHDRPHSWRVVLPLIRFTSKGDSLARLGQLSARCLPPSASSADCSSTPTSLLRTQESPLAHIVPTFVLGAFTRYISHQTAWLPLIRSAMISPRQRQVVSCAPSFACQVQNGTTSTNFPHRPRRNSWSSHPIPHLPPPTIPQTATI